MKLLAFDTATPATTVALDGVADGVLEARDDPSAGERPHHATRLLPMAAQLLDRAGIAFADLDRIAVGTGPGTFTGLRIGVATARALAHALDVPLVGVLTLQSLALNGHGAEPPPVAEAVAAVIDARRGEAFSAVWRLTDLGDPHGVPLIEAAAYPPQLLAELLGGLGQTVLALGDGAVEFRSVLERSGAVIPDVDSELHRVTAVNHCRLARVLEPVPPDQVQPHYLRLPDAEIARRAAGNE